VFLAEHFQERRYEIEGVEARRFGEELFNAVPQLKTWECLVWPWGGGTGFEQLCELLKANVIPAKTLEIIDELRS